MICSQAGFFRLILHFSDDKDHKAGADDREDQSGQPAAADMQQIADQAADEAADDAEYGIHDKALLFLAMIFPATEPHSAQTTISIISLISIVCTSSDVSGFTGGSRLNVL